MTIQEIRLRHEKLFHWAEETFRERCKDTNQGDPMEAAMLMEACLASISAIHLAEQAAQVAQRQGTVWRILE